MNKRGAVRKTSARVTSREVILRLLKQKGPMDAEALASQLDISAMAVRQHLYALRTRKLLVYQEEPRPIGRPAKVWSLTAAADPCFADAHAGLTVNLLNAAKQTFGVNGVKRILLRCTQQQIGTYRSRIPPRASLHKRLKILVRMRNDEGYMAELERQQDGSFILVENHCAISAAANECPKLCEAELALFRAILGEGVVIERTEHILRGARRCAYRIRSAER
jgi:predicted ArsR family transcriptional regulator